VDAALGRAVEELMDALRAEAEEERRDVIGSL
jgi:hypothetical protein